MTRVCEERMLVVAVVLHLRHCVDCHYCCYCSYWLLRFHSPLQKEREGLTGPLLTLFPYLFSPSLPPLHASPLPLIRSSLLSSLLFLVLPVTACRSAKRKPSTTRVSPLEISLTSSIFRSYVCRRMRVRDLIEEADKRREERKQERKVHVLV